MLKSDGPVKLTPMNTRNKIQQEVNQVQTLLRTVEVCILAINPEDFIVVHFEET